MRWAAAALAVGLAAVAAPGAHAYLKAGPIGYGHWLVTLSSPPLDGFTAPAAAYSMRRLKSSYSGPALRLRRASDNAEADIPFLGYTGFTGAPIDTAAAAAHCAATTCTVAKAYDQSGNARHVERAFPDQPAIVFDCQNGLPCLRTSGAQLLLGPSLTPGGGGKGTFGVVANRQAGTGNCFWLLSNGTNNLRAAGAADTWALEGSSAMVATAADNTWHAGLGVINDASSVIRIDATETAGTVPASAVAGNIYLLFGSAATTCALVEGVYWDNYFLTAAERAALAANQRSFWNF